MAKHAYLAASASERWLRCPPSAKLCAQEEDRGSPYAQQGTDAHELAAYLAEKALGRNSRDPTENLTWYDAEMQEAAEGYAAFVMEQVAEAKKFCPDPLVCIEQTLDFSKWVEHGFGTGDCVIVADDLLHIVDLKYGVRRRNSGQRLGRGRHRKQSAQMLRARCAGHLRGPVRHSPYQALDLPAAQGERGHL